MFYIAILILVCYLAFIGIKYKLIPTSISNTYYLGANWWFTIVMWLMGFTAASTMISVTPENFQFLAFLTGAGLLFVGAAPLFKDDAVHKIHYGGALVFAISSLIWVGLYSCPLILLTWASMGYFLSTKLKTFWAEIVCVINIILAYVVS